ncbi:hypothetical protein ISP15_03110 [Dyella jejuensis]|uniref:MvdD-like pre-ATP grasp domain-containing protein n=1 Tax=Dyella jejuensis TaxID=1432009 RepID=A0ABW8JE72_9GAMM
MKKVFICTHINDAHAMAAEVALKSRGHKVVRWIGADIPSRESLSFKFSPYLHVVFRSEGKMYSTDEFDVVWWRRLTPALLPSSIHPGDKVVAEREWEVCFDALENSFRSDVLWINPVAGQRLANDKVRQLVLAKRLGFKVPKTLISNDVVEIGEFINSVPAAIHKMFAPTSWKGSERYARARTTQVTSAHLAQAESLRLCPGIFQERVFKKKEIRATFMGEACISVEIEPKDNDGGVCDWRSIRQEHWKISPCELPPVVVERCRKMMHSLGIVFGCFDIIIDAAGDYVFLEVNQMGQFLWKELDLPNLPMLQTFCDFVASENASILGLGAHDESFQHVLSTESYREITDREYRSHVDSKPYILDNQY